MATIHERYDAAAAYVQRAVDSTKPAQWNPLRYVGDEPTVAIGKGLQRLELEWMRATNDLERARVARDTELLADRVEESLPGAPQNRARTNLFPGEVQRAEPAAGFLRELAGEFSQDWHWLTNRSSIAAEKANDALKLLLVGGGLWLAVKALDAVAPSRDGLRSRAELNRQLEAAADKRDRNDDNNGRARS